MGEVAAIEGGSQKPGFGEFAEYTYMGILTMKPKYVEFLTNGRMREHIDLVKFTERVMYRDVGITLGKENGSSEWKKEAGNIPTVGVGIWILDNSQVISRGDHLEEGYK